MKIKKYGIIYIFDLAKKISSKKEPLWQNRILP